MDKICFLYISDPTCSNELLDVMSKEPLLHYLDIPIQHCDKEILRRMNRGGSRGRSLRL